jgi:hypothetical protein
MALVLDAPFRRRDGHGRERGPMFGLTLVDHLRLTFGHVICSHRAHAELADRYSRWSRWLQGGEALLLLGTTLSSVALLTTGSVIYAWLTAVTALLATSIVIARLVANFDARVQVHRICSTRLWRIREQYRALLADLKDGHVTLERACERRDALMRVLANVYENAPPADRAVYESARRALPADHEQVLSDEEIDQFLPASLQKGRQPAA